MNQQDKAVYNKYVSEILEVKNGKRGWVSIVQTVKNTNLDRKQLKLIAEIIGLKVETNGSRGNGLSVSR